MDNSAVQASPVTVDRLTSRLFVLSWIAAFVSTSSAFLILLTLSARVQAETGSVFLSAGVFASQWTFALAAPPIVALLTARYSTVSILSTVEFISALFALAVAALWDWSPIALFALLASRGVLEAVNKSLRFIPLKVHLDPVLVRASVGYLATAQYLASGAGAVLGLVLVQYFETNVVLGFGALLFVASGVLYRTLRAYDVQDKKQESGLRKQLLGIGSRLRQDNRLAYSAFVLIGTVVLYQALHNIARADYPATYLSMPMEGAMWIQLVSSIGILVGAVVGSRYLTGYHVYPMASILFLGTMASSIVMFGAVGVLSGLVLYGLFILLFELTFVVAQADVVDRTPASELALLNSALNSTMTFFMALAVVAGGLLADVSSLFWTTVAFFIVGIAVLAFAWRVVSQPKV